MRKPLQPRSPAPFWFKPAIFPQCLGGVSDLLEPGDFIRHSVSKDKAAGLNSQAPKLRRCPELLLTSQTPALHWLRDEESRYAHRRRCQKRVKVGQIPRLQPGHCVVRPDQTGRD